MDKLIIGCSAISRSGKDTFFNLFKNLLPNLNVQRFALADDLKKELYSIIRELYGIDIFNCTAEEKELVRPLMVFHGKIRRIRSNGRHWIEILDKKIRATNCDVAVITDVRYDVYKNDERPWLQDELKGVLLHISRYNMENIETAQGTLSRKIFTQPPNQDEAENNPKLISAADYRIEWESCPTTANNFTELNPHIEKFIQWLKDAKKI